MSASDNLSRVQFRQDDADRMYGEPDYDDVGQDSDSSYGYTEDDVPDYLYKREGLDDDDGPM